MKKTCTFLLIAGALAFSGPRTFAQAAPAGSTASSGGQIASDQDIKLLREDIRSQKKQLIAANLSLTDTEATKFWPVYDQYTAEFTKIQDAKAALIKDYAANWGTMTDAQALDLLHRSLNVDAEVTALRQKYVPIVNKVLPGTKTATFFQLDRRISMLIDLQLASKIPLVQSQN
ncbi:MAG TPA: hypothetical protein VL128_03980 [Candidatus Eisenbacteria bacterium]|nr:hypothetical protein [Candidatus Eisenbacteria bacterium]